MEFTELLSFEELSLNEKIDKIKTQLKSKNVIVAFSGGVDSSLVAYFAKSYAANVLLIMQIGLSVGIGEKEIAQKQADQLNLQLEFIEYEEYELDQNYTKNPENRCYFCKRLLHQYLDEKKSELNFDYVLNGTNWSDLQGHRPGYQAIKEYGVLSPLIHARINKEEVRMLAAQYNLIVQDKPATACLASRFTTGVPITKEQLDLIARAEYMVKNKYFLRQIRIRYHGTSYHLEVDEVELEKIDSFHSQDILDSLIDYGINPIKNKILIYGSHTRGGSMNA